MNSASSDLLGMAFTRRGPEPQAVWPLAAHAFRLSLLRLSRRGRYDGYCAFSDLQTGSITLEMRSKRRKVLGHRPIAQFSGVDKSLMTGILRQPDRLVLNL
jgi:hypothetical protein